MDDSRILVFLVILLVLLILEFLIPIRRSFVKRKHRWVGNLGLSFFAGFVLKFVFPFTLYGFASWCENYKIGLLYLIEFGSIEFVIGFLVLDFFIWLQHLLSHIVPWFWRLHRVHHSDITLDVTSALRFHPLEIFLSYIFKAFVVALFGIAPIVTLVFEIVLNAMAMFNHSNIRIPYKLESFLNRLIVTPQVHLVHHGDDQSFMFRNFGFNLVFWDKIFGFYREKMPSKYRLGLKQFRADDESGFFRLLFQPFRK